MTRERHPVTYWPDGERKVINVTSEWAEARAEVIPQIRAARADNGSVFKEIKARRRLRRNEKSMAALSTALPGVEVKLVQPLVPEALEMESTAATVAAEADTSVNVTSKGGIVVHSQSGQIVTSTHRPVSEAELAWQSGIML